MEIKEKKDTHLWIFTANFMEVLSVIMQFKYSEYFGI